MLVNLQSLTVRGLRPDGTYLLDIGAGLALLHNPEAALTSTPFDATEATRLDWPPTTNSLRARLSMQVSLETATEVPPSYLLAYNAEVRHQAALDAWKVREHNKEKEAKGTGRKNPGATLSPAALQALKDERAAKAAKAKDAREKKAGKGKEAKVGDGAGERPSHLDSIAHPPTVPITGLKLISGATEGGEYAKGRSGERGGINPVFAMKTPDGEKVFKPQAGEHADARQGTRNSAFTLAEREVVSSRANTLLGLDVLPPTTMAKVDLGKGRGAEAGMMQDYIPLNPKQKAGRDATQIISRECLARFGILDAVTGQLDRHSSNFRVGKDGRAYAMDNGYTFGDGMVTTEQDWQGRTVTRLPEARSFALGGLKEGDLSVEHQKAIGAKLRDLDPAVLFKGSHANRDEINAFKQRQKMVSTYLLNGEAHKINSQIGASIW